MARKRKRFDSLNSAQSFAEKVNGQVNDLTEIPEAKSKYTVTYERIENRDETHFTNNSWMCPEEGRDFGYPNWYWQ